MQTPRAFCKAGRPIAAPLTANSVFTRVWASPQQDDTYTTPIPLISMTPQGPYMSYSLNS